MQLMCNVRKLSSLNIVMMSTFLTAMREKYIYSTYMHRVAYYLYVFVCVQMYMGRENKERVGLGKASDLQGKFIALHVLLHMHQYSN